MSERIDRLALRATALGHGGFADQLSSIADQMRTTSFDVDGLAVFEPEVHLELIDAREKEWRRQAYNLANIFAERLGMTKDEYVKNLPDFNPIKINDVGRFDIPLIVPAHGLSILETATLSGLKPRGKYLSDYPDQRLSMSKPYVININGLDTVNNLAEQRHVSPISFFKSGNGLESDERFLDETEAIALFLNFKLFPRRPNGGFDWVSAPATVLRNNEVTIIGSLTQQTEPSIFPWSISSTFTNEGYTAIVSAN